MNSDIWMSMTLRICTVGDERGKRPGFRHRAIVSLTVEHVASYRALAPVSILTLV